MNRGRPRIVFAGALCALALTACETTGSPSIAAGSRRYATSDVEILATATIFAYRELITEQDASRCVFTPTCSHYMEEAIQKHGLAGIFMGMDRLSRCHPLNAAEGSPYKRNPDGTLYDPVK